MPLQFQTVPVTIGALDQKKTRILRGAGSLDSAINVEFDKDGALSKRRGYQLVTIGQFPTSRVVGQEIPDAVLTHVATLRDELVLFTYDSVVGMGDRAAMLRGEDAFVFRGPCNRGNCRMEFVSQARISQEFAEEVVIEA